MIFGDFGFWISKSPKLRIFDFPISKNQDFSTSIFLRRNFLRRNFLRRKNAEKKSWFFKISKTSDFRKSEITKKHEIRENFFLHPNLVVSLRLVEKRKNIFQKPCFLKISDFRFRSHVNYDFWRFQTFFKFLNFEFRHPYHLLSPYDLLPKIGARRAASLKQACSFLAPN